MPASSETPRSTNKPARRTAPSPSPLNAQPLGTWQWALFVIALVLPITALTRLATQLGPVEVFGGAVALSALTYFASARDKRKAQRGQWRTPESTLHLLELCGGWPGSFLAQHRFRHKLRKVSYQFTFWLIVAAHEAVAYDFLQGWRFWPQLRQLFSSP